MAKNTFADFVIGMAKEYEPYRRKIMERFSLSAAEVDVLMFLSNNPEYNTATQVSKIRMIPKSHVSLAVGLLSEKGLLCKQKGKSRRTVCLIPSKRAAEITDFGRKMQDEFQQALYCGFSETEKAILESLHRKITENMENIKKSNANGDKNR